MDEWLRGGLLENQADDSETGVAKWRICKLAGADERTHWRWQEKTIHLMRQGFFGVTVKERELMESQGEGGGDGERVKWARFEGQCRAVG